MSLRRFATVNVAAAYLILALVLALFSPVADPALMVADHVARLKSGALSADEFNFRALKYEGARWGNEALSKLSQARDFPQAALINIKARDALANSFGMPAWMQSP